MNLSEYSVRKPVTTLMTFFAVLMIGIVCIWQIPIDRMPKMDLPVISVITNYDGAAPEDVEKKVTEPLERNLSTVPDIKHITSTSKEELSVISLTFEWGTDLDTRSNDVRDAVGLTKRLLPDEIDEPRVLKLDVSRFPILVFGVTARESYNHLEKILQDEVADPLLRLPGVGSANVMVPLNRQVNVDLDRGRLASYNLTPQDVVHAIARENLDTPAGNVKKGLTDYLVRVPGEYNDVAPMRQIVIASHDGATVKLSDVGNVEDSFEELSRFITINGDRGAIVMVQKQSDANTVQVANLVKKRMEEIQKRLPPDIKIINVMDGSEDIIRAIKDLTSSLLLGGLFTMLTVLIFLRQWRTTIIICLTIPFSLILAIVMMYFFGYTINMMTLFAMIIAVGMIVDNAIVILENITRHREEGERPTEGAIYGASEVAMPVIASTITNICIFFPILFVKGITGVIFTEFAIITIVVMMGSLFSALTLTPMLSSTLLKKATFGVESSGKFFRTSEKAFRAVEMAYGNLVAWALRHRAVVVITAILIFGGTLFLVPILGTEFMPDEDQAMVQGSIYLPVGTRLEETVKAMKEMDKIIKEEVPEKERIAVFTRCGSGGGRSAGMAGESGSHIGSFGVKLVPRVDRSRNVKEIAAALRQRINKVQGLLGIEKYRIEVGDPMASMLLGGERPLTVNVIGNDMDVTDEIAAKIKQIAINTPGTVDINVTREKGRPELRVRVDRDKASAIGFNVSDIGDMVRAAIYGTEASKYRIHGDEYTIFVRYREKDRSDIKDVLASSLRLPSGKMMRVDNVANVGVEYGPVTIERKDQGRIVNVMGSVENRSLGDVVADIEKEIAKLDIPPGVEVIMSGQTTEQRESFFWLTLSLIVGIFLVYMIMASQFESLLDPFVVMFSVPFAFTGTIWAIFLGGHHISIVVFLGLLMLVGIVVNNAIVLVDYTNLLRVRGLPLFEAVPRACRTRLRPVLMTSLTTIAGLIPMAFGKGQGSEVWNPIGLTVLGGLLVSTFVTLVLVPTVYSILEMHVKKAHD